MSIITPDQSRQARKEFGLSQADVAEATGLKRQYLSEFESDTAQRFTASQLRKLRAFYEGKLAEANDTGEQIDLTFGSEPASTDGDITGSVETVKAKRFFFPVADEVAADTLAATLATITANDKKLAALLTMTAEREEALFGEGDYTEDVLQAMRDSYALLAANYLLVRSLGGWPEIGLSASGEKFAGNDILSTIMGNVEEIFVQAGLLADSANDDNTDIEQEAAQ